MTHPLTSKPLSTKQAWLRLFFMFPLGIASGLPLALASGTALQAWLTTSGLGEAAIGFIATLGTPYTLKFLWAPLLDRYWPSFLDPRRSWLVLSQCLISILLVGMAGIGTDSLIAIVLLGLLLAATSATQDIALDAYRTEVLPNEWQGLGATLVVYGYRIGMLISGGLAFVLADSQLGWRGTYAVMAGCMLLLTIASIAAPSVATERSPPKALLPLIKEAWADFSTKHPHVVMILIMIVLYKLGDAFAGSLTTTFLLRGLGFSQTEVGVISKGAGLIATLTGAMIGGLGVMKLGIYRSLMLFGILQAISNFCFLYLSLSEKNTLMMAAAIMIENGCGAMGTAAFVAFLTSLCSPRFSATQYALLSALASFGRVYLSAPSGLLVEHSGWVVFFMASVILSLPGLFLLHYLRDTLKK